MGAVPHREGSHVLPYSLAGRRAANMGLSSPEQVLAAQVPSYSLLGPVQHPVGRSGSPAGLCCASRALDPQAQEKTSPVGLKHMLHRSHEGLGTGPSPGIPTACAQVASGHRTCNRERLMAQGPPVGALPPCCLCRRLLANTEASGQQPSSRRDHDTEVKCLCFKVMAPTDVRSELL